MKAMNKKKVKELHQLDIQVRTVTNGYMLELNKEGYMYYNAQSLLEGFCIHVGLERLEAMTKEEIQNLLKATKDGSIAKKLQAEVTELKVLISEQKKVIREQKKVIKELSSELKIEL